MTCLSALADLAGSASAAFPGRDGLLVVRPLGGRGVLLANARSGTSKRVCLDTGCETTGAPRWSPNGQMIAVATGGTTETGPQLRLIYTDGSCFDCSLSGTQPAFGATSTVVTSISGGFLRQSRIDGLDSQVIYRAPITDAVTSGQGRVAVVRRGLVQIQVGDHLEVVSAGGEPAWSANGSQLGLVRGGWIYIVDLRHHRTVRLVRGSSPAWAPDGHAIAYVSARHQIRLIAPKGGRSRAVGRLRGQSVDWQPVPAEPPTSCQTIPNTSALASSGVVTLTEDPANAGSARSSSVLSCLASDGHQRVLTTFSVFNNYERAGFGDVTTVGDYAAMVTYNVFEADVQTRVEVFDLRTGQVSPSLGGESPTGCCGPGLDHLQLNDQGVTAVHATEGQTEQIIASDHAGQHVLDSVQNTSGTPVLTNLALSGDTLTWQHNGQPEAATLN